MATSAAAACSKEEPKKAQVVGLEEGSGDAAESYILFLNDLATIMDENQQDPQEALTELRAYIAANRDQVEAAIGSMEQLNLSLSETARTEYQEKHAAALDEANQRFIKAQQRLRAAASEAQRIELTEVLNTLN